MKVKICGITDMETAKRACEYGADALGFVFAESKKNYPGLAKEIIQELPANVLKIGVFVNESVEVIQKITENCGLTHVQLHGDEDNHQIRRLNIPSIKALGVTSEIDMKMLKHIKRIIYCLIAQKKGFTEEMERHFLGSYLRICQRITRENDISWWIKCS